MDNGTIIVYSYIKTALIFFTPSISQTQLPLLLNSSILFLLLSCEVSSFIDSSSSRSPSTTLLLLSFPLYSCYPLSIPLHPPTRLSPPLLSLPLYTSLRLPDIVPYLTTYLYLPFRIFTSRHRPPSSYILPILFSSCSQYPILPALNPFVCRLPLPLLSFRQASVVSLSPLRRLQLVTRCRHVCGCVSL